MIKIGLIGCGYWGPNLLRNFAECSDCSVKFVADFDQSRLAYVKQKFPKITTTSDFQDVISGPVDAVVIATPPPSHYHLAKEALKAGKHVLVEKPLAMSVAEAEELLALSRKNNLKLMAGHTFEFNNAVRELKKQIQIGTIGKPYYLYSQRLNFGIVRKDINALWNLAPHDISILIYLLESMPTMVSARGYDFIQKGIPDVVFMVLNFPNDIIAHVQVSWLDPSKVRRMTVVGSDKMIIYDDVADAKLQIHDKGLKKQNISESLGPYDDFGKFQTIRSAGDVLIPKINFVEPLRFECQDFVDSIVQDRAPLTDGENGLRVVRVLEAAQKSMDSNGENVNIIQKSEIRTQKVGGLAAAT